MINTPMKDNCCPEIKPLDEAEQILRRLYIFGAGTQGIKVDHFYFDMEECHRLVVLHRELKNYLAQQLKKISNKKKK